MNIIKAFLDGFKQIFWLRPRSAAELRKLGAVIGDNFDNYGNIDLDLTIGDNVTLSTCHILLHDASTKKILGFSKIGRVAIGNNVFIGAGSVVSADIPDDSIAVGNPCKKIGSYEDYSKRMTHLYEKNKVISSKNIEIGKFGFDK